MEFIHKTKVQRNLYSEYWWGEARVFRWTWIGTAQDELQKYLPYK